MNVTVSTDELDLVWEEPGATYTRYERALGSWHYEICMENPVSGSWSRNHDRAVAAAREAVTNYRKYS